MEEDAIMKNLKLTLTSTVLLIVLLCTGCKSIESEISVVAMQANLNIEVDKPMNSVLDEKIKTTFISDGNSWYAEDDPEIVLKGLATESGIYCGYLGVNCFPICLAQRDSHSFDLAGIVNEKTIYTITRLNDKNIGEFFVYNFYAPDYNIQLCNDEETGDYYTYEQLNVKPFKEADDILIAAKEAKNNIKDVSEKSITADTDIDTWDWVLAGLEIRVAKHLSAEDFAGISIGSTIEDVTSVDPITAMSQPRENSLTYDPLKFDTFHYTDDGILKISFARKAVSEEFLVSEINLNKTFEVSYDGSSPVDGQPTVKLKINPEHLPD